jgi:tripartite-type tricarboxylate transporter receptor subunit TctC
MRIGALLRRMSHGFLARVALAATLFLSCHPAAHAAWPEKPVRVIVPFGAGSTPDIVMRIVADRLKEKLGQPFLIENKPGASGNLGTDAVAKAEPDGYTFGLSIIGPLALNKSLFAALPYDPQRDLETVTTVADQPSILAVNADVPADTLAALIALLRSAPEKYNYASIGNGSLSHLAMAAIAIKSATRMTHIPYGSSPQAMTALMRGDVQIACLPAIAVASQISSGKIRMLAVTSAQRSPFLPDVPTLREGGIDVEANAWNGLIAPAKTPAPIIDALNAAVRAILAEPAVRDKLAAQMMTAIPSTPQEFQKRIAEETLQWEPLIRTANIQAQ